MPNMEHWERPFNLTSDWIQVNWWEEVQGNKEELSNWEPGGESGS